MRDSRKLITRMIRSIKLFNLSMGQASEYVEDLSVLLRSFQRPQELQNKEDLHQLDNSPNEGLIQFGDGNSPRI